MATTPRTSDTGSTAKGVVPVRATVPFAGGKGTRSNFNKDSGTGASNAVNFGAGRSPNKVRSGGRGTGMGHSADKVHTDMKRQLASAAAAKPLATTAPINRTVRPVPPMN